MIYNLTSKNNNKIKYACSLKLSKNRNEFKQFLAEGYKSMQMALEANLLKDVFTLYELDLPEHINQYIITNEILEKLSNSVNPEGIVFISDIPNFDNYGDKILFLDNVNDPGNMGTLIRTALSLGYSSVIYNKGSVSPFNEKAVAASKGAIFKLPVLEAELKEFKNDYQIIVSALHKNSIKLPDFKAEDKFVLVLGNEAHGVSIDTLKLSDAVVEIPIEGMESLNVAIAGGILMYELNKK